MNNNDCLIGYTGFVGQKLLSQKKFKFLFNSKNINKIKNKKFNYVFCAGAPGIKWMANKYPKKDLVSINALKKNIEVKQNLILDMKNQKMKFLIFYLH